MYYEIYTALNRYEKVWHLSRMTWEELVKRFTTPTRTNETFGQFMNMSKNEQDKLKDVGGFVGGKLKNGIRKSDSIVDRCIITLDADFATEDFIDTVDMFLGGAYCIYSTRKNTAEKHRYRLVIPLSRIVTADEYEAVARKTAELIGIDAFDDTTYQPHRLMYWPSCSIDGHFEYKVGDGKPLDADEVLAKYGDWKDVSRWPKSTRTDKLIERSLKKQEDPREKKGVIGAFCRTYDIKSAIDTFLSDIYSQCANENRFTYVNGSSAAGLVVYDDIFAYSNHATDPASGKLCNAFDLVRIHKFGDRDDDIKPDTPANRVPSFKAMQEFAANDENVKILMYMEKQAEAAEDFGDDFNDIPEEDNSWIGKLKPGERGKLCAATIDNVVIILTYNQRLKGRFGLNEFTGKLTVKEPLWWNKETDREWSDTDSSFLRSYLEKAYDIKGKDIINDAINIVALKNKFHPVREYLESLEWDGEERAEKLFCDYLGAKDCIYTRAVTRKILTAAVARVFVPGIKFDNMLVLVGAQGRGKSEIIKRLGRSWFSDTITTIQGKDAYEQIQGFWLIEIPELQAMKKADVETIKMFTSKSEDSYRAAYDRFTCTRKRQCVFFGTTNRFEFLKDTTGNRRFWPVDISPEKSDKNVFADMDEYEVGQIWAEAVGFYKSGEKLYLDTDELEELAAREQDAHLNDDPMTGAIIDFLDMLLPENWDKMNIFERRNYLNNDMGGEPEGVKQREKVCIAEIWCELYGEDKKYLDRRKSREIADIIMKTGEWERLHKADRYGKDYGVQKGFKRKM